MPDLYVKPKYRDMLKKIFAEYCPLAEIWAYGSRVNGDAHAGSDLDLAVINFGEPHKNINELRQIVSDSNVPFLVDLLEFKSLPAAFQNEIRRNFVKF